MWGRCRVDVMSMRGLCLRSIIINVGERLVTPPSPIFYNRGAFFRPKKECEAVRTTLIVTERVFWLVMLRNFSMCRGAQQSS